MKRAPTRITSRPGRGVAVIALLAVFATGCGDGDAATVDPLEGSRWEMTSVREGDGLVAANLTTIATAVFADGTVTGSNGCNLYQATYSTSEDTISFSDPTLTGFACDPDYAGQGEAFIAAMQASERFSLSDESLELDDASNDPRLRFRPTDDLPLVGVSWVLTGYAGPEGGLISPLSDTGVSLNLLADRTLTGIAGCNSYNGVYEVNGNELTIGELTRTAIGCVEPDGVMTQERDYLAALQDVEDFTTTLTGLELVDADGTPVAEYRFGGRIR